MAGQGASVSIEGYKELQGKLALLAVKSRDMLRAELSAAALLVKGRMIQLISEPGKGREYKRRSVTHRASAPFDPPATDTGMLKGRVNASDAITFTDGGLTVEVGPRRYKTAEYLEFGTRDMAPRPFAYRSLEMERARILGRIKNALKRMNS